MDPVWASMIKLSAGFKKLYVRLVSAVSRSLADTVRITLLSSLFSGINSL